MTIVILLGGRDSSQLVGHNITFVKYIFGKSSNQFDRFFNTGSALKTQLEMNSLQIPNSKNIRYKRRVRRLALLAYVSTRYRTILLQRGFSQYQTDTSTEN